MAVFPESATPSGTITAPRLLLCYATDVAAAPATIPLLDSRVLARLPLDLPVHWTFCSTRTRGIYRDHFLKPMLTRRIYSQALPAPTFSVTHPFRLRHPPLPAWLPWQHSQKNNKRFETQFSILHLPPTLPREDLL